MLLREIPGRVLNIAIRSNGILAPDRTQTPWWSFITEGRPFRSGQPPRRGRFLLEHLPPQMHLVIASHTEPPLPLPRLLAANDLTNITASDLRFTLEEAA